MSRSRSLLAAGGIALFLSLVGWFGWHSSSPVPGNREEGVEQVGVDSINGSGHPADPVAEGAVSNGEERRRQAGGGREEHFAARGFEVLVVRGEKGSESPVPRARVYLQPQRNSTIPQAVEPGSFLPARPLDGPLRTFPCDDRGRTYLPYRDLSGRWWRTGRCVTLTARSPDGEYATPLYGGSQVRLTPYGPFRRWSPQPRREFTKRLKITVYRKYRVHIRLRDGSGRVVPRFPVGLFLVWTRWPGKLPGKAVCTGRTDAQGRCTMALSREKSPKSCFAGFPFPFDPGERRRWFRKVEKEHLEGRELELCLPPVGSLEVCVGEEGSPTGGERKTWVCATVNRPGGPAPGQTLEGQRRFLRSCRRVLEGRVLYPRVGVGTELRVYALLDGNWRVSRKVVAGPARAGEKVVCHMSLPMRDPRVRGILLDSRGRPFGGEVVHLHGGRNRELATRPGRTEYLGAIRVGPRGRFAVNLPWSYYEGPLRLTQLKLVPGGWHGGKWPPFWVVDLPPSFTEGTRDLGVHRLQEQPVLLRGRVLDSGGEPVAGAEIRTLQPERRGGEEKWSRYISYSYAIFSDRAGAWCIRGRSLAERLRVGAFKQGLGASTNVPATPGTRGIELVLPGSGAVAGRLVVAREVYLRRRLYRLRLVEKEIWNQGSNRPERRISPDGSFTWTDLLPGIYELQVRVHGEGEDPLVAVPGIRVVPGRTNRDPSIQGIDLRGRTEEVLVRGRWSGGEIVDPGDLYFPPPGPGGLVDRQRRGVVVLKRVGARPQTTVGCVGSRERRRVTLAGRKVEVTFRRRGEGRPR